MYVSRLNRVVTLSPLSPLPPAGPGARAGSRGLSHSPCARSRASADRPPRASAARRRPLAPLPSSRSRAGRARARAHLPSRAAGGGGRRARGRARGAIEEPTTPRAVLAICGAVMMWGGRSAARRYTIERSSQKTLTLFKRRARESFRFNVEANANISELEPRQLAAARIRGPRGGLSRRGQHPRPSLAWRPPAAYCSKMAFSAKPSAMRRARGAPSAARHTSSHAVPGCARPCSHGPCRLCGCGARPRYSPSAQAPGVDSITPRLARRR